MRGLQRLLLLALPCIAAVAEPPVAIRVENFTAPPSTGPVTHVTVCNLRTEVYDGDLRLQLPEGWEWAPNKHAVTLGPRETRRIPFTIEKAANTAENSYAVGATCVGAGTEVIREQRIVCASAPYFKPEIDGDLKDWDDAIPVSFLCRGRETIVRTYWNRRAFCLAVTVDEEELTIPENAPASALDAVQFALAAGDAETGAGPDDMATRSEFLIAAGGSRRSSAKCFFLLKPGMPLSAAQQTRGLAGLEFEETQVAVKRKKGLTHYECAVPFAAMPGIRPGEGREIRFSVLIHDPDGTGVRDWGEAAGLWPSQRNPLAWCSWNGIRWGKDAPFDGKIEWGLCSSIH